MTRLRHTFGVSDLVAYRQSPSVRLHSVSPSVGNDGDSEKKRLTIEMPDVLDCVQIPHGKEQILGERGSTM